MPLRERISTEEVNALPMRAYEGEIVLIDSVEQVEKVVKEIEQFTVVGFDTESKPAFKKGESYPVSLLQFATPKKVYLFRVNLIGMPKRVSDLLSNPNLIKLGIALHDDIKDLRQLGVTNPQGFQDIHSFIKDKGVINTGLRKLAAMILGFRISKSQQTSNWENEVLNERQQIYAATDAWVCLKIYEELKKLNLIV
ncbi:3'-5' exonuclease domain protein [hydrothermal vent metagenome]|uniref:3'-5' exonuclease domain protein n=1 Tax=hydrothermal vent metagenome TaxID=652676 RepID=A0A3B0V182_9ZZZZ